MFSTNTREKTLLTILDFIEYQQIPNLYTADLSIKEYNMCVTFPINFQPCSAPVPGLPGWSLPRLSSPPRPQTQIGGGGKNQL